MGVGGQRHYHPPSRQESIDSLLIHNSELPKDTLSPKLLLGMRLQVKRKAPNKNDLRTIIFSHILKTQG